jgi:HKD family nuclease
VEFGLNIPYGFAIRNNHSIDFCCTAGLCLIWLNLAEAEGKGRQNQILAASRKTNLTK